MIIRKSILKRTDLDIEQHNPEQYVGGCYVPALFVLAWGDDFVRPHHGEALYRAYAGDKNILYVEGDHNSERPAFCLDSVAIFFYNALICDQLPNDKIDRILKGEQSPPPLREV
jgi:hypothetical protein